jgi:hypothetical protein
MAGDDPFGGGVIRSTQEDTMRRSWAVVVALILAGCEPVGPIPGGALSGELVTGPVEDWSLQGEEETIFVETRPSDPHSVTVWCVAHEGALYIPSRDPGKKRWVQNLMEEPAVRLKIAGRIYERRAVRVTDPAEFEAAGAKLIAKYEIESEDIDDATEVWLFRIEPRSP